MHEPGNGKCGNKVGARKQLLDKVECSSKESPEAAKHSHVNNSRDWGPDEVEQFAKERDREGGIAHQVHQDTKGQRRQGFLLYRVVFRISFQKQSFQFTGRYGFFRNSNIDGLTFDSVVWHASLRKYWQMGRAIHIGTSGWSYKHWREIYYPHRLASSKWLNYYAQTFHTTEVNGSFYRLPSEKTVLIWMEQVPKDFIFCVKMSRFVSHMKKLRDPEESLERFFEIFRPMKKMMGPILIQLPPFLKFNYDVAEQFYQVMKKHYRGYEYVMEVRHETWLEQDSLTLMTKYDAGLVISQSGNEFPYAEWITAKNIYVRFHGPKELYASSYSDEMLQDFARKFRKWEKEGHEVWAFFNNDIHGYAVTDALRLMEMVKK